MLKEYDGEQNWYVHSYISGNLDYAERLGEEFYDDCCGLVRFHIDKS